MMWSAPLLVPLLASAPLLVPLLASLIEAGCIKHGQALIGEKLTGMKYSARINACISRMREEEFASVTFEECKEKCTATESYLCQSVEYKPSTKTCWLSKHTKATQSDVFKVPCDYDSELLYSEKVGAIGWRHLKDPSRFTWPFRNAAANHTRYLEKAASADICQRRCKRVDGCNFWSWTCGNKKFGRHLRRRCQLLTTKKQVLRKRKGQAWGTIDC